MGVNFDGSMYQGFNFKKEVQDPVGYLINLKIGTQDLAQSFTELVDPEDFSKKVKAVGVVTSCTWDGGLAESITLHFQVSTKNQQDLMVLVNSDLSNTEVEFEYNLYTYDNVEKKYFKCFHTDGKKMKGMVLKSGGNLALSIAQYPDNSVPNPENFAAGISIMPAVDTQVLQWAASVSGKKAMNWGVKTS
jgi:hypothetical protein